MTDGPWTGWTAGPSVVGDLRVSTDKALAIHCQGCDRLVPYSQDGQHVTYSHTCTAPKIQLHLIDVEI